MKFRFIQTQFYRDRDKIEENSDVGDPSDLIAIKSIKNRNLISKYHCFSVEKCYLGLDLWKLYLTGGTL